MKLYVGNLPYQASEGDLQDWFSQAGISVDTVTLVRDRFSGDPRGFGFVEIHKDEDAEMAVRSCNGKSFMGRALVINEARPQPSQGGGGFRREGGGQGGKGAGGRGPSRGPRW